MTSTVSKRQQLWVCWQEPESDRGKLSLIPSSWIAKCMTGDGSSPGSLILCRWPRSDELFTAKIMQDPTPTDLAQLEVMEVPAFMEGNSDGPDIGGGQGKFTIRGDRQMQGILRGNASGGSSEDGVFVMNQLKRFFLGEMGKISNEMQANFDILGHRIGALEVNMKCVRERVERIENILNTAVNELEASERNSSSGFLNLQIRPGENEEDDGNLIGNGRRIKQEAPKRPSMNQDVHSMTKRMAMPMEQEDYQDADEGDEMEPGKPVVIPRGPEHRPRKDRNPRPRAVVITCPRNRNVVLLGGNDQYRMPLATYLDAIRHAKRPTATYMVTALLRRYLPPNTLAKLCVNERQLANTVGGQLVDEDLLEALKKQGYMQFPNTSIVDRELMLRIEDVTRDVRRKIKLKKAMAASNSKQRNSASSNVTPITMVAPPTRASAGGISGVAAKLRSRSEALMTDDGSGRIFRLEDADQVGTTRDSSFDENPEALPMFS